MIFYTADLHFGYLPLVEKRGFASVEEMDEALVAAWNRVVGPEDTVYLLGDIGWNQGHVPCRMLARLKGRKHLVRGNHDTGYVDAPLLYRYFDSVTDFLEIDDGGEHILLSHYPMLYSKPKGYMIHGHLHNSPQFHAFLATQPRILNAGVDVNNLVPVTLEQLIANNKCFYSVPKEPVPYRRGGKGALPGVPDFRPVPQKPAPHRKHLFLTGRKQVGKSTALRALLDGRDAIIGGFRTQRVGVEGGADIYMLPPTGDDGFVEENILFRRRRGQLLLDPANFDRLGGAMLAKSAEADLILMDELGPTEAEAYGFQKAVLAALDGDIPVYGVLQMADSAFLDQIMHRDDVHVVVVNEENRNTLPQMLLEQGW